jgi:hypothetical protein
VPYDVGQHLQKPKGLNQSSQSGWHGKLDLSIIPVVNLGRWRRFLFSNILWCPSVWRHQTGPSRWW